MFPFQSKQKTILERLNRLVEEGKQHLRKDLAKEIKTHLDEVLQAAHKALTTKHKADLDQTNEELKTLKTAHKALAKELAATQKRLAKVHELSK